MPAVVMDDEASRRDAQYNISPDDPRHSSRVLSRVTTDPGFRAPDRSYFATTDPRIPLQKPSASHNAPAATHESSSPGLKHRWSAAGSTPSDTLERPDKRLRLDDQQEQGYTETFRRGGGPAVGQHEPFPQISQSLSNISSHRSDSMEHGGHSPCSNCWGIDDLLTSVVESVFDLQLELSRSRSGQGPQNPFELHPQDVTKQGLKHSLGWSANEIRNTIRLVQGSSVATKAGLPSLTDVVPGRSFGEMRRASLSGQGILFATPTNEKRQAPILAEPKRRSDDLHRRQADYAKDYHHPYPEPSLPPIVPSDASEMRRSQAYEQGPSGSAHSPHPSSGSSIFGHGHSPIQSQQHQLRSLPSPPGSHFSASAMSGPSQFPSASQAAQTSHLQDLQHQISTKTLALQTLQREHDQLLAAFSRSQIRCNTLDKKSQVSDHEINTLTEEKIRLQQQVESLEALIEDLQKSRDEVHKQLSADGAQWRQIMAMSSQLQTKGAEDARRFKAERDTWEQERASLERRIQDFEGNRGPASIRTFQSGESGTTTGSVEDPLSSTSLDVLRREIVRLRGRCSDLEVVLQEVSGETEQLDRAITAMSNMRQKIASSKKSRDEAS